MTMPNFCINFLNKAEKSLPILYDFTVASLADAWIKIETPMQLLMHLPSHPSRMRGLKCFKTALEEISEDVASLADAWIKIRLGT